jgi:acyl carrier protein
VVAGNDPAGGTRLEAYVVFHAGTGTSVSELRRSLREKLPEVMLPSVFIPLETLPLTPSGKIDRLSLPRPDGARLETEESYVAPRTPYEVILAEVWQEVLGRTQVGAHDNFFDIGGHSLLATQVMARVRSRLDIDLPVRHLFEAPTLAGLAQRLERALVEEIEALDESEVEQKLVD